MFDQGSELDESSFFEIFSATPSKVTTPPPITSIRSARSTTRFRSRTFATSTGKRALPQASVIANGMTGDLAQRRPFSDSAWIRDHADRRTLRRFALVLQSIGDQTAIPEATTSFVCSDPMVRNLVTALGGMLHDARADRPEHVAGELRRRLFSTCERGRVLAARAGCRRPGSARHAEEESEFQVHAGALASRDFSVADERFDAFMAWLDGLEPATSQRFEKSLAPAFAPAASAPDEEQLPTGLGQPAHAPLERYSLARRERARTIRALLALAPAELARHTDRRAVLTFAQAESANLDSFVDPGFRDRLVRERALQRSGAIR